MQKTKRLFSTALALVMIFSLLSGFCSTAHADDLDTLKARRDTVRAQAAQVDARITDLKANHAEVLKQKEAYDERDAYLREQLELNHQIVAQYTTLIAEKEQDVTVAKAKEEEQLQKYRTRVRAMEENGGFDYYTAIMHCTSLSDVLGVLDDISAIMEADKKLEDEYVAARENHESIKAEYEEFKAETEDKITELNAEEEIIVVKIQEAAKMIQIILDDIDVYSAEYESLLAEDAAVSAQIGQIIAAYQAQQAAAAAAAAQANGGTAVSTGAVSGSGILTDPFPAAGSVSSKFGNRNTGIAGASTDHKGIDIDGFGLEGSAIVSADAGTVITAGTNSGYGNYVIVDHGNGMQTVYAHMASLNVSAGQTVSAGEQVGVVGSTGIASGTHLHFEVRENGQQVDPSAYLGY